MVLREHLLERGQIATQVGAGLRADAEEDSEVSLDAVGDLFVVLSFVDEGEEAELAVGDGQGAEIGDLDPGLIEAMG